MAWSRVTTLSGPALRYNRQSFREAIRFQTRLDTYMRKTYLPLFNANTTGSHMFWEVVPHLLCAENIASFVHNSYGVSVHANAKTNALIINPPVTNFKHVKSGLDLIADIIDGSLSEPAVMLPPSHTGYDDSMIEQIQSAYVCNAA